MSERKYRQRGYMDDEPREERSRPGPASGAERGPRGRGLGAPTVTVFRCSRCGFRRDLREPIEAATVCAKCGADLRSCTHCRHFDSSAPNECREPVETRISKKAHRNECELFAPRAVQESDSESERGTDAKSAFDALFDL